MYEAFRNMSMDRRWADRTPQEMHDSFHWFHGEGFRFIIEDLEAFPRDQIILVEGFQLLPKLVKPYLASRKHAVWLIATPAFRIQAFTDRGSLWNIPNKTSNPEQALQNHLERERIFADRLAEEVESEGFHSLKIDGSLSEEEYFDRIVSHFGLRS